MRLIDADELKIDYGFTWDDITPTHDEMYALIDRQPTIEERKTGKWIYKNDLKQFFCSECGFPSLTYDDTYIYGMDFPNYCEDCGAKMEAGMWK